MGSVPQIFCLSKSKYLLAPKGVATGHFSSPQAVNTALIERVISAHFFSSCVLLTPSNVVIFKEVQVLNSLTYLQAFIWSCNSYESVPGCPECFHRKEQRERLGFLEAADKFGNFRFSVSSFETLLEKKKKITPNPSLMLRLSSVMIRLLQNISD